MEVLAVGLRERGMDLLIHPASFFTALPDTGLMVPPTTRSNIPVHRPGLDTL